MKKFLILFILLIFPLSAIAQQPVLSITIKSVLTISTPSPLNPCTVGVACSQTILASGGQAPLTFSILSQTTNAKITSAGVLSLTASAAGTFSITVAVADSGTVQQTSTQVYSITVNPVAAALYDLSWTGSTSPGVSGYNVFSATQSGGPYTKVNPAPITPWTYTVQCLGICYYVVTSVSSSGNQSGYSNQVKTP